MRFTSTCVPYFQIKDKHGRHPTSKHNLYHRHLLRRTRTESICHLRKSSNNKQVDSFYQPGRGSSGSHIHTATKPRLHQLRTSVFISNLVQHYWEGGCLPRLATISLYAVIQQHYEEEKNTDRPSETDRQYHGFNQISFLNVFLSLERETGFTVAIIHIGGSVIFGKIHL